MNDPVIEGFIEPTAFGGEFLSGRVSSPPCFGLSIETLDPRAPRI
jgi:hypothetical protein